MKNLFLDISKSLKETSTKKKIFLSLFLLLYLLVLLSVIIKVDCQVTTPGSISATVATLADPKDYWVVKIDEENLAGEINTVGVYNHTHISLFQYLISRLSPRLAIDEYDPKTMLSREEEVVRGTYQKEYSIIDALIVAYEAASLTDSTIKIEYDYLGMLVTAITKNSDTNLKPGDIIQSIDGNVFETAKEFLIYIKDHPQDEYQLQVLRGKTEMSLTSKLTLMRKDNWIWLSEIQIHEKIEINKTKTHPAYEINDDPDSIGSSGGAMMALAIYNALTKEDLTAGKFIIGTGTISLDGVIGQIGGVSQKIATASMYDVDIFFVSPYDYDEALVAYNNLNNFFKPSFKLIKVSTFQDIITELEALNGK